MPPTVGGYGTWASPVSAATVAEGRRGLGAVWLDGGATLWTELRPAEGGRNVLMRAAPFAEPVDVTPEGFNVRTRVHEYGGGAFWVREGVVVFANLADQRLYRQDAVGSSPEPITPDTGGCHRYADGRFLPGGGFAVCVRERHETDGTVVNELVRLPADGSEAPSIVAEGADFFAAPRPSPDGSRLTWIRWNTPQMPWDGTELWVADLAPDGATRGERRVAGGAEESILQPVWSPTGALHVVSDRSGWWNLYRVGEDDELVALHPADAEFASPPWEFGSANFGFLDDGRIAVIYERDTVGHLALLDPGAGEMLDMDLPFTTFAPPDLDAEGMTIAVLAGGPAIPVSVVSIDFASRSVEVLRETDALSLDPSWISEPEPFAYPSAAGRTAHALFSPPRNPDAIAPAGERPPLIVMSHGGPTDHAVAAFDLRKQFWTTRGFAVVDVNYGGSSGYGRAYRGLLEGAWGIVDTEDCIAAARFLAGRGDVDGRRMAIRGGSAGGYTTLCALTFHSGVFAAGASYFGVADAEALARDTHKFESRYLDGLIGPYPEAIDRYRERSPIHATDRLETPLLVLQGDEDQVVPPAQAEELVAALRSKGLPHAYLLFRGEQHGFRSSEHIRQALEAELSFYAQIMGFVPAGDLEPLPIENPPD
ncbi:MAG: prolyl oligopeptidase family serine peptidase [Actinomycetota bacterium]